MQTCCRVDATAHAKWSIASKMLVLQQHWSVRWMRRLWAVAQCTHPAYVHPVALAGLTLQSLIECTMVPLRFSSMARRWFSESAIGNWFPQGCPECADVKPSGPSADAICRWAHQVWRLHTRAFWSLLDGEDRPADRPRKCPSALLLVLSCPPRLPPLWSARRRRTDCSGPHGLRSAPNRWETRTSQLKNGGCEVKPRYD